MAVYLYIDSCILVYRWLYYLYIDGCILLFVVARLSNHDDGFIQSQLSLLLYISRSQAAPGVETGGRRREMGRESSRLSGEET